MGQLLWRETVVGRGGPLWEKLERLELSVQSTFSPPVTWGLLQVSLERAAIGQVPNKTGLPYK